jgi:hypothetical protein
MGSFTPEQGSQSCREMHPGASFYGNNPVKSDVKVNEKTTIDGHDAWLVESQLSFDITGLKTKGELLIVRSFPLATGPVSTTHRFRIPPLTLYNRPETY